MTRALPLYYSAKFVAQVAQNLMLAALLVAASSGHGSAIGLSGLFIASLVPGLLFGIAGGALVDRVGASRGYVLGAVLRIVPIVVGLFAPFTGSAAWAIAFAYSAASQVFSPAEMALVDVLERDRPGRAHSLLVALQYGGQALGMLILAPALYFAGGPRVMLAGAAAGFVVVIALAVLLHERLRASAANDVRPAPTAFHLGATCGFFVDESRARYAMVTMAIKTAVTRGIIVALPLYLSHDLGLGHEGIVFLLAPGVVGAALGLLLAARTTRLDDAAGTMRLSVVGMVVAVLALAVFDYGLRAMVELSGVGAVVQLEASMNTTFVVALPAAFLLGLSLSGALISSRVALTATAPRDQQARVFAVQDTVTESLLVLPLLLTGIGTEVVGARATLAAIGIVGVLAVAVLELPRFRHAPLATPEPASA
ncbi:MAG: MFS transporter [Hyphomicrobiales bacterium]